MWFVVFFFFKQKTAYEMRISDWSSDVCSSDLTLVDAIDAGVAEETLGVIFGEIAGAAIDLDAGIDDAAAHFGCEHLERRGLAQDVLARIGAAGDVLHHAFGGIDVDLALREPLLDQLEIGDRLDGKSVV